MYTNKQELYKISPSTKKMMVWFAYTEGAVVTTMYGDLGGKLAVSQYTAEPKNEGRSNATTAEQQAQMELQSLYKAQLDNKHYQLTQEDAQIYADVAKEPRKIKNYKDGYKSLPKECLSSIKLNGSRACVIDSQYLSKIGRVEDVQVEHLRNAIMCARSRSVVDFDAEVYAHGLSLQRIRSAFLKPVKTSKELIKIAKDRAKAKQDKDPKSIRTQEDAITYLGYNPNEDAAKLKLYIFDIPTDTNMPYKLRVEKMHEIEEAMKGSPYEDTFGYQYPVVTHSHEERMKLLEKVVADGYEGLVHYDPDGVYEFGKRSTNTQKSKPRYDSEALCYGVELCKNGEGKLLLRACDALDNAEFKAMMLGEHSERLYENQQQYIGQWINFQYEEISDVGVPTKPVATGPRDCDSRGNPLE